MGRSEDVGMGRRACLSLVREYCELHVRLET